MEWSHIQETAKKITDNVSKVIFGKEETIVRLLTALLCSGHVLFEDIPGTGKTQLAKALAKSVNGRFSRIQFTPDLLPADVTGSSYFDQKSGEFAFRPGPVFANLVLADELNRATPRTQSSLLECMEEGQVTADGETRRLGKPFIVMATQNPIENQGTFPLPEAQLDRFLMKLSLGYPSKEDQIRIIEQSNGKDLLETIGSVVECEEIEAMKHLCANVHISRDVLGYIVDLAEETRKDPDILLGVSPRGVRGLVGAVQAYASIHGRPFATPDDVKALIRPVWGHRLILAASYGAPEGGDRALDKILTRVPVPQEDVAIGR